MARVQSINSLTHSPKEEDGDQCVQHDVDQMVAEWTQTMDPEVDSEGQNGQRPIRLVAVDL